MRCGECPATEGFHQFDRPVARRIDQQLVELPQFGKSRFRHREQIHRGKPGVAGQAVQFRILSGARHQRVAALDAQHLCAAARDGQREIPQSAEKIGDAFARLRIEQAHRPADHHPVHRAVHLGKFARRERHGDAELRQDVI